MKRIFLIMIGLVFFSCGNDVKKDPAHHEDSHAVPEEQTKSLSPHTSTMALIDDAHIHIDYSSPSVRERIIFGGLVGYNTVWQAGAHKATWIETDKDLSINGEVLPAGKYGFFVIPGKDSWKVIFNSRWDQHGKDEFDEAENVLVMDVAPTEPDEMQESLIYEIEKTGEEGGIISLSWEKVKIEVPFQVIKN